MGSEFSTNSDDPLKKMKQAELEFEGSLVASTLAHEIRNPLQTIRLQLELASRSDVGSDVFNQIMQQVSRLEAVVEKVQKLSEKLVAHVEKANLREIVESSLGSLRFWLEASGIETRTHYQWEGEPLCVLDRELIQQLLLNLMMNAIQAMPTGGVLSIYIKEELEHAVIEVTDSGAGISEDVLSKVGTPFFTTKVNGNGLGLAFCKTIAALHGGSLTVQSTKDSGTQIICRILKDSSPQEDFEHVH